MCATGPRPRFTRETTGCSNQAEVKPPSSSGCTGGGPEAYGRCSTRTHGVDSPHYSRTESREHLPLALAEFASVISVYDGIEPCQRRHLAPWGSTTTTTTIRPSTRRRATRRGSLNRIVVSAAI